VKYVGLNDLNFDFVSIVIKVITLKQHSKDSQTSVGYLGHWIMLMLMVSGQNLVSRKILNYHKESYRSTLKKAYYRNI